jgi:hypothetical protein
MRQQRRCHLVQTNQGIDGANSGNEDFKQRVECRSLSSLVSTPAAIRRMACRWSIRITHEVLDQDDERLAPQRLRVLVVEVQGAAAGRRLLQLRHQLLSLPAPRAATRAVKQPGHSTL